MKISGKSGSPMQSAEAAKLNKSSTDAIGSKKLDKGAELFSSQSSSAKVDLSSRAQDIKKAKEVAMASSNDIDEAKVARLQKLIDEGKYKVDADAIAEKLLDEHSLTPS